MATGPTRVIEVRKNWIPLLNTERGAIFQQISGVPAYYFYSVPVPPADEVGHRGLSRGGLHYIPGGSIWVRSEDYSVVAYTPFDVDGASDGGNGNYHAYDIIITEEMIDDKGLILMTAPPISNFTLDIYSGSKQRKDVDFLLEGNAVRWNALALEMLLEVGSVIAVTYTG